MKYLGLKTGAAVRHLYTREVGKVLGRSTMRGYWSVEFPSRTADYPRWQLMLLADRFEDYVTWEIGGR